MKKSIIWMVACLGLASCEDVLENKLVNEWGAEDVWRIPSMAQGVLNKAYANIDNRPDHFENNFLDAATDNATTTAQDLNVYRVGQGLVSEFSVQIGNWSSCYENFQFIHQFMENGLTDNVLYSKSDSVIDAATKKRLLGEAYFLRAWWGFQLLRRHGGKANNGEALGYPIVKHFITEEEGRNPTAFVRNTYEECVMQIVADCDSAIAKLPAKYTGDDVVVGATQIGRACGLAAAILKVNALMYGASPACQPDNIVRITGMGSFQIVDETAYKAKWERVALYADTLLRNADGKFGAFGSYYAIKASDLADATATTPADFIFRRMYNNHNTETYHFPPFYYGSAGTTPSQNLVDAFPMKNGYPVSAVAALSGYDPQNPYVNRDNRFELNIYYHGKRFAEADDLSADAQDTIDVVYGGKDSRSYSSSASRTGYYLSKFISKKNDMLAPTQLKNSTHYNPMLRKGEVFLAFAEASNEVWGPKDKGPGCQYSAYDIVKTIRQSSGGITSTDYLDEMALNADDFRKLLQNERRLETTFEDHRFYDMRRWLLPLNEPLYGISITRDENGALHYEVQEVEKRKMDEVKYYYLPVPYDERVKNPNLVNNLGWN
ncbi:MAG: RagB/SusD family nutrient uptake outer membrane protein [Prevotella sp.]|nr:RagB/SusD family nutrient uptake outer membrane protein [Prevotella sp.]